MQLGTVNVFRDDSERRYAELVLRNGDRIYLMLDRGGLTIAQIGVPDDRSVLFQAKAGIVAHLCAGLVAAPGSSNATPLRLLVSVAVQLDSANQVRTAFEHAAAQVS